MCVYIIAPIELTENQSYRINVLGSSEKIIGIEDQSIISNSQTIFSCITLLLVLIDLFLLLNWLWGSMESERFVKWQHAWFWMMDWKLWSNQCVTILTIFMIKTVRNKVIVKTNFYNYVTIFNNYHVNKCPK